MLTDPTDSPGDFASAECPPDATDVTDVTDATDVTDGGDAAARVPAPLTRACAG